MINPINNLDFWCGPALPCRMIGWLSRRSRHSLFLKTSGPLTTCLLGQHHLSITIWDVKENWWVSTLWFGGGENQHHTCGFGSGSNEYTHVSSPATTLPRNASAFPTDKVQLFRPLSSDHQSEPARPTLQQSSFSQDGLSVTYGRSFVLSAHQETPLIRYQISDTCHDFLVSCTGRSSRSYRVSDICTAIRKCSHPTPECLVWWSILLQSLTHSVQRISVGVLMRRRWN